MPLKQPFNEAGVLTKITELYTLSDLLLQEQAAAARLNFPLWLNNNFLFSEPQSNYLSDIPAVFTDALGYQFSIALGGRLPITLIEPIVIDPDDYSSKILQTEETPSLVYNSVDGFMAIGELSVKIFIPGP